MRFLPLTSLDGAFFEKFPLFSNFLRKLLPDPGRPSGGRCTAACNKRLPPRGKAPAGGCGARRPGAPSPWVGAACGRPGWQGAALRGAESLRGCGCPPQGQGPFLFLRKKKRSLTPRQNEFHSAPSPCGGYPLHSIRSSSPHKSCAFAGAPGPVYGALMQRKRRLASLRTVVRTSPGRYGHPMVEQGWFLVLSCGRLALPLSGSGWSGASLAAEGEELASDLPEALRPTRGGELHAARGLLPHSAARVAPAGGGWLERRPVFVPRGQAVTAGGGPLCHTKAAGRRGPPLTHRRPGPLFLWGEGPFLFPQKKKWSFPPEGIRPLQGGSLAPGETPPLPGRHPGGAPSKFSIASKYQIGYNSRRR